MDDSKTMTDCVLKNVGATGCDGFEAVLACYPKCACDMAATKTQFKTMEALVDAAGCDMPTCGSGAMAMPSVGLVAMLVAAVYRLL